MYKFNVNKIKGLLAEYNEMQIDLAILLCISKQSINNKLNLKSKFNVDEIATIANHYKKDISYFFEN